MSRSAPLIERLARIDGLILDVDGVLTDGSIVYLDAGGELKRFHVRDGSGLKLWQRAGKRAAIVSGRRSALVDVRAAELGVAPVLQGRAEKLPALREILQAWQVPAERVAAIGDDLPDVPMLRNCGVGIAVADACAELRAEADFVTPVAGGHGAVRAAIEWILQAQGRWADLVEHYTTQRLGAED